MRVENGAKRDAALIEARRAALFQQLMYSPPMTLRKHFVGRVEGGAVADLFSDARVPAGTTDKGAFSEGDIVEAQGDHQSRLAPSGSAEAALYGIAGKHRMNPVFPDAVEDEVARLEESPGLDDPALEDLEHLPFVTIDGASSRDLDQAAYVEKHAGGDFTVHYALADAGYYVRPGTALHAEALLRGASYYLPGFMVPMLPRALSEGLVSLNPHVSRRALLFSMKIDTAGECTETRIRRVRIRSQGKLSFAGVQAFYDGGEGFGGAIDTSLRHLAEVGTLRMERSAARGVVRYRRQSVATKLATGGVRFSMEREVRRLVERYNEQLSLLCNIEGARLLQDAPGQHVEPIYRAHPSPTAEKMQSFEQMLAKIVTSHQLDSAWQWDRTRSIPLARYLDGLPTEGPNANIAAAIHRQAVMANVRSMYQTEAAGHHGVGASVYARFSAPMREIVGVFLHRELVDAVGSGEHQVDESLRREVVTRANTSKSKQRAITNEANRLVLDQLFGDAHKQGRALGGVLMGVQRDKAYVRLNDPPIDAKIYLRAQRTARVGEDKVSLVGGTRPIRIGDSVSVEVKGHDADRDRWVLVPHPA